MMELKHTLRMPKTEFDMKANLPKKEPVFAKKWEDERLYERMLKQNENKTPFVLHDGPPYANGLIHLGHAMNKILKDIVVRSHSMLGYYTPFIPGWDTHGLPIENAIQKLGHNRKDMTLAAFRTLCEKYAYEQVEKQMEGMKRLGTIGDYDHPYITLQKIYEANQIKIFGKMATDGLIYK